MGCVRLGQAQDCGWRDGGGARGLSPEQARMQRSGGRAQGLKLPTVPQDKLRFRFDVRVDHVSFQADGIDRPLAVALSRGGKVAQTARVRMNC